MTSAIGILLVVIFCICARATPVPPTAWPSTWHTWLMTTINVGTTIKYEYGQLLTFNGPEQYTCRYNQQQLLNSTSKLRPADFCDYAADQHYHVNDANATVCTSSLLTGALTVLTFPTEVTSRAKYLGQNKVAQKICDHFYSPSVPIGSNMVNVDIWTTADGVQWPCQITVTQMTTPPTVWNWAFDGFDTTIPPDSNSACAQARFTCVENNDICVANPKASNATLGSALGWVCGGPIDCSPINPGGDHYLPNTLVAHCDWAFNDYYQANKQSQGEAACNFGGAGILVPPTTLARHRSMPVRFQSVFDFPVFQGGLICS